LSVLVFSLQDSCAHHFRCFGAEVCKQRGSLLPAMHATMSTKVPRCLCIDWLVHLELDMMDSWPFAKVYDRQNQAASFCNLRTLHFVACCPFLKEIVRIPTSMRLREFVSESLQ